MINFILGYTFISLIYFVYIVVTNALVEENNYWRYLSDIMLIPTVIITWLLTDVILHLIHELRK